MVIAPVVWSVSFPMKSQPIKLMLELGKLINAVNFWFNRLGIDLSVKTHSLMITPPELTHKIESMSLAISNSASALTQAFCLYLTSCWASLNFSVNLIPEWANIIRLKFTSWPFSNLTLITGPVFPMIITLVSLSLYSIVRPGTVIGLGQVYTPSVRRIIEFSSARSIAFSNSVIGPFTGSTSMNREYSKFLTILS